MKRKFYFKILCGALLGGAAALSAQADSIAKHVVAQSITGVVVEAGTGKPMPNVIVAIRFVRHNTGHGSPHCFRSMAVETDAQGHFRFAPWSQDNTLANFAVGELSAYKAGYAVPWWPMELRHSTRAILGISFSDTIHIPKQAFRLELKPYTGTDEVRMGQVRQLISQFICRWQAQSDDMVLMTTVRKEIAASPIANQKTQGGSYTHLQWIDENIRTAVEQQGSSDPRATVR